MPTAAKLVAAVVCAIVAYLAAAQYAAVIPDGRPAGLLREVSAVVGFLCGWFVLGNFLMKPRGQIEAMGTGMRTSVTMTFILLMAFSVWEMLLRAIDGRYKNPLDSILDIFGRALVLGKPIFTPGVLGVLLLGGLFAGVVAHYASTRWK